MKSEAYERGQFAAKRQDHAVYSMVDDKYCVWSETNRQYIPAANADYAKEYVAGFSSVLSGNGVNYY